MNLGAKGKWSFSPMAISYAILSNIRTSFDSDSYAYSYGFLQKLHSIFNFPCEDFRQLNAQWNKLVGLASLVVLKR